MVLQVEKETQVECDLLKSAFPEGTLPSKGTGH